MKRLLSILVVCGLLLPVSTVVFAEEKAAPAAPAEAAAAAVKAPAEAAAAAVKAPAEAAAAAPAEAAAAVSAAPAASSEKK